MKRAAQGPARSARRKAACLMAGLAIAATTGPALARSLDEIRASGELRICIAAIHPSVATIEPPDCAADCRFSGPAVEAAEAFAGTLDGVAPLFRQVGWDAQFQNAEGETIVDADYTPALLADGSCDVMPNHMTVTDWRLKKMDIVPMFENRMIVMLNSNRENDIAGISDLAGKTTAAELSTSFHVWLERQNAGTFADDPITILDGNTRDTYAALDDGRLDFALADANAAVWLIRNQLANAEVAFAIGEGQQIGWALNKRDHDLRDAVESFFASQKTSQTSDLNRIWETHFGVTLSRYETLVRSLN